MCEHVKVDGYFRFIPSSSFHFFATSRSSLLVSPLLSVPVSVLIFFFYIISPADHNFNFFVVVVLLTVVCGVVMLQLFFFFFLHYSLGSFPNDKVKTCTCTLISIAY